MKKYFLLTIIFACSLSAITFAQVDSADLKRSEKRMMKAEQRRVKQEKRVKRANAKMEKSQKRLNRQNRKLNKANRQTNKEERTMEKQQQKLEETKKDSIPNTSLRSNIPDTKEKPAKTAVNTKTYWPYNKIRRSDC